MLYCFLITQETNEKYLLQYPVMYSIDEGMKLLLICDATMCSIDEVASNL